MQERSAMATFGWKGYFRSPRGMQDIELTERAVPWNQHRLLTTPVYSQSAMTLWASLNPVPMYSLCMDMMECFSIKKWLGFSVLIHIQLSDEVTDCLVVHENSLSSGHIVTVAHHYDDFHLFGKISCSSGVEHGNLDTPRYSRSVH